MVDATGRPGWDPLPAHPPLLGDSPPGPPAPPPAPRPAEPRGRHPSRRARAVALVSSVVATGAIGAAMAAADRSDPGTDVSAAAPTATPTPSTASSPSTTPSTTTPTASGSYADGVYTGESEFTRFGDVQVQVTIHGGQVTDVTALEIPSGRRSSEINARAEPVLESEALAKQASDLDVVSGATYTSETYATSLQSALDEAATTSSTTS